MIPNDFDYSVYNASATTFFIVLCKFIEFYFV